ncbi:MAG: DNA mismatch repair protein MutL, partial [Bacteroidia bacterium]|nr:DNA mismatch repair protein MutL [Bacteroidia bacterium]
TPLFEKEENLINPDNIKVFQVQNRYLVSESSNGVMLIDQQRAHERVLYEQNMKAFKNHNASSQQELFPMSEEFSPTDFNLLMDLKEDLKNLGFDIEAFGKNTIVIHGTPSNLGGQNSKEVLDSLLEAYKLNNLEIKTDRIENLCRSMAYSTCIKYGKSLNEKESKELLTHLFACENYLYTPSGKNIVIEFVNEEIERQFRKR